MGQEVVVTRTLSEEMIKAGASVIAQLDRDNLPVGAALWLYYPEAEVWRLVIGLPKVKSQGPKQAYERVQSTMSKIPNTESTIGLQNISVVDTTEPLLALLRRVIATTGGGISGIRFSRNTVNGVLVEDAYIYRLT